MACSVALRLPLMHRCALPGSSAAQPTEQELGKDKEECPKHMWRGPYILVEGWEGDKRESVSGRTW